MESSNVSRPRLELGTLCVLGTRDNRLHHPDSWRPPNGGLQTAVGCYQLQNANRFSVECLTGEIPTPGLEPGSHG